MIYLLTHIIVNKHYNNFITQFIIGTIAYIVLYLLAREFINYETYEEHKYYLYSLITIDISFLLYRSKITKKYFKKDELIANINLNNIDNVDNTILSISSVNNANNTNTQTDIEQILDASDYKIEHDINSAISLSCSIEESENKN